MIKIRFLIFMMALFCILHSCGQTKNKNNTKTVSVKTPATPDPSKFAILPYDNEYNWIFKDGKNTKLTEKELNEIETFLKRCIDDYNVKAEEEFNKTKLKYPDSKYTLEQVIIDLTKYKRQYIAVLNAKEEKEVWINCFCDSWNIDWEREIIIVMDGGNCYFNLKINLAKQTYYEMMVNGEA